MKFPVFIFHEIIIRLDEINPAIRRYTTHIESGNVHIFSTTNGLIIIPTHFLDMQAKDPMLISIGELNILTNNFKPDGAASETAVKILQAV